MNYQPMLVVFVVAAQLWARTDTNIPELIPKRMANPSKSPGTEHAISPDPGHKSVGEKNEAPFYSPEKSSAKKPTNKAMNVSGILDRINSLKPSAAELLALYNVLTPRANKRNVAPKSMWESAPEKEVVTIDSAGTDTASITQRITSKLYELAANPQDSNNIESWSMLENKLGEIKRSKQQRATPPPF